MSPNTVLLPEIQQSLNQHTITNTPVNITICKNNLARIYCHHQSIFSGNHVVQQKLELKNVLAAKIINVIHTINTKSDFNKSIKLN